MKTWAFEFSGQILRKNVVIYNLTYFITYIVWKLLPQLLNKKREAMKIFFDVHSPPTCFRAYSFSLKHVLSSGPYSVVLKVSLSSHKNCLGPHILFWSLYLFFHKILQWIVYTFSISSYPASHSFKKQLWKKYTMDSKKQMTIKWISMYQLSMNK